MSELQNTLRSLHVALGNAGRLDSEDRALLETVLTDIQNCCRRADPPTSSRASMATRSKARPCVSKRSTPASPRRCVAVLDALAKAGI
jgi:hypothetical protein